MGAWNTLPRLVLKAGTIVTFERLLDTWMYREQRGINHAHADKINLTRLQVGTNFLHFFPEVFSAQNSPGCGNIVGDILMIWYFGFVQLLFMLEA